MHDFEWQESDRAITVRCRLPLLRRLFLSVVLLGYLFWVGVLLLSFFWNLGASPTDGIPWRFVWLLQQTLPAALAAGNLLCALLLAWITIHSALLTPETTLRFDKQARLLTISQVAPASRPRTPATTENSRILESCALRIRLGALTTQTVGVTHPPQGYFSGYGIVLMVLSVCLVFFSTTYSPILSDHVLHQNGALVTARVQNKSPLDNDSMLIRYAFVLPSGREINAIRDVHPELVSKLQEGDLMAVRYDRNQPKRNMVVGDGRGRVTPYLFVNLLWLFGLVLGVGGDFDQASPGKPWGLGPRNGWC